MMKNFADEMQEAIEKNPTAEEAKRLYERDGPPRQGPERKTGDA